MTRRTWTMDEAREARWLYEGDMNSDQVGAQMGYSRGTITTMVKAAGGTVRGAGWTEAQYMAQREAQVAQARKQYARVEDQAAALFDLPFPGSEDFWTFEDIGEGLDITTGEAIKYVIKVKHLKRCILCEALVPENVVFCDDCRDETRTDPGELIKRNSPTALAIEMWGRLGIEAARGALVGEVA